MVARDALTSSSVFHVLKVAVEAAGEYRAELKNMPGRSSLARSWFDTRQ